MDSEAAASPHQPPTHSLEHSLKSEDPLEMLDREMYRETNTSKGPMGRTTRSKILYSSSLLEKEPSACSKVNMGEPSTHSKVNIRGTQLTFKGEYWGPLHEICMMVFFSSNAFAACASERILESCVNSHTFLSRKLTSLIIKF